ncbi:hypothetical protein NDU88_011472 [Pleurodeles waltl]|uniref:Uncharacterized protein n=1 Tax=Pleurodeles waltl TaxID=8319 RepID=A0AAV7Q551_PLEWA|nr:hypothetical protein NDU88_011472 [Pleurodeles waltl]
MLAVIWLLKPARTRNSDGLPEEYSYRYARDLSDQLLEVYGEALQAVSLPPSMREAMVVMILKLDRDPKSTAGSVRSVACRTVACCLQSRLRALECSPMKFEGSAKEAGRRDSGSLNF